MPDHNPYNYKTYIGLIISIDIIIIFQGTCLGLLACKLYLTKIRELVKTNLLIHAVYILICAEHRLFVPK